MISINIIAILVGSACFILSKFHTHKSIYLLTIALITSLIFILPKEIVNYKIYAFFGQLSVTSLALLSCFIIQSMSNIQPIITSKEKRILCVLISAAALVFYPLALGLTTFDPYSLGFEPKILSLVLAAIAFPLLYFGFLKITAIIAVTLIAFNYSTFTSNNLWDYLLDPVLAIYCINFCIKGLTTNYLIGNKTNENIWLAVFSSFSAIHNHNNFLFTYIQSFKSAVLH